MQTPSGAASPTLRERLKAVPRQLKQRFDSLMHEHASPARLGVAVGVGVLVGASPFLGFQVLMALGLAALFRLNKLAVFLGIQVSMPPITPFLLYANAQVGSLLRTGAWLDLSLDAVRAADPKELATRLFLDLLLGGLVVGGVLAGILGGATAHAVSQARLPGGLAPHLTPEQWAAAQARLKALPRFFRHYAAWKLKLDPVYARVLAELPEDVELVDLGSGMGLLPLLLTLRSPKARVRAVEWDARKVDVARKLVSGLPVEVEQGDARTFALGRPKALTLIDVMHYSPVEEQRAWLERCAEALAPGGVLLIRELEPGQQGRRWAPLLEKLAVGWGWNRGATVQPWPPAEMVRVLTARGYTAVILPAGSGAFRANSLVVARKPSAPTS